MKWMRPATRKKRERVTETALQMFIERGFENVSVDDIIERANISKGTFYHYFRSKEEILLEWHGKLKETIRNWLDRSPQSAGSAEGQVNRLLLDLAGLLEEHPKLAKDVLTLALRSELLQKEWKTFISYLYEALLTRMNSREKTETLISVFWGTVVRWSLGEKKGLEAALTEHLTHIWDGLRSSAGTSKLLLEPKIKETAKMRIAIIGGGLAGLTAAAYLSQHPKMEGILFERSPQLGGRAFTYEKSGFTLNYGAHAVYGIDRHTLSVMERELGIFIPHRQVDRRKVMYEKFDQISPAPLDFVNLMKTDVLNAKGKVRFVTEIAAIMANIHAVKNYATLGDFLAESNADENVKELWEHLVCSNFFITPEDARKVPGSVISEYYHNLFLSSKPVGYILGSWSVITEQLKQKIASSNRWEISLKESVEGIRYEDGKYILITKKREVSFDQVVFAMPVQQVSKLLQGTPWEPFLAPYKGNTPTEVLVYDIGLEKVVARPFSYISDMNHKLFISDVSATDHTLVPEGGQLLQGIAYLGEGNDQDENGRSDYLDKRLEQMERLFDRHYPGWREAAVVKRVSKKAMVQSVKNIFTNRMLPNRLVSVPFFFCGDGCEGKGELAERAFSSGRNVAKLILDLPMS